MSIKTFFKGLFEKKDKRNLIEKRIDEIAEKMKYYGEDSNEYTKMIENLKLLTEANASFKESEKKSKLSSDVLFNGIVAFLQIIVILVWEERHCIRTEATRFMTKLIGKK